MHHGLTFDMRVPLERKGTNACSKHAIGSAGFGPERKQDDVVGRVLEAFSVVILLCPTEFLGNKTERGDHLVVMRMRPAVFEIESNVGKQFRHQEPTTRHVTMS